MRSDRRRQEREEQKTRGNRGFRILSIIYLILAVCFIASLLWLNVLPPEYLYPIIGVVVVISLFIAPVMYSRNGRKKRKRTAGLPFSPEGEKKESPADRRTKRTTRMEPKRFPERFVNAAPPEGGAS